MSWQVASRKPISKSAWLLQTALSFAYLVTSIIGAAQHYPWPVVVGVTGVSFVAGFALFRPSWAFAMPMRWSIAVALGAIALGMISFDLISRFAPNLMDGVLLGLGGLWLSTSLRGTLESQRAASASD